MRRPLVPQRSPQNFEVPLSCSPLSMHTLSHATAQVHSLSGCPLDLDQVVLVSTSNQGLVRQEALTHSNLWQWWLLRAERRWQGLLRHPVPQHHFGLVQEAERSRGACSRAA